MSTIPSRRRSSIGSVFADTLTHNRRRRSSMEDHMKHYYEAMEGVKKDEIVTGWDDNGEAQTISIPDKRKDNSLHDILGYMLVASQLMYSFAWLRRLARETAAAPDPGWWSWLTGSPPPKEVQFKNQELILAETVKQGEVDDVVRYLKRDVHASDVTKFIEQNLSLFDEDGQTSEDEARELLHTLDACRGVDQFLAEFDDQFSNKECVYALIVNREHKRVIVVFRGSVVGGKDWQTNFNTWLTTLDTPKRLKHLGFNESIRVHQGFKSYLFDETHETDTKRPKQKFDDVVDDLKRIYTQKEFASFELFITGHSLGGALCTLLAFKLAGSKRYDFLPKQVTVVSFASPKVGDNKFNEGFELLEKQGFIRAVRVSNQGDMVPVAPPSTWPILHGLTQTGVNLHLHTEGEMEAGHRNLKSFVSQSSISALQNHSLAEYHARLRLKENVEFLFGHTVEDLYSNKDIGFTD